MPAKGGYPYEPDYVVPPGWILEDYLEARGMTAAELGKLCRITAKEVKQILVGEAPIENETAKLLGTIFELDAKIWLRMEASYREGLKQGKNIPSFEEETVT